MKTLVYLVVGLSFLSLSHTKPTQAQVIMDVDSKCSKMDVSTNTSGEGIRREKVVISSSEQDKIDTDQQINLNYRLATGGRKKPINVDVSTNTSGEGIRREKVVISSSEQDKIDTDQQINLNYRLATGGRKKPINVDDSVKEVVVDSQQTDSPETDYNWMTCYIEGHICSEINLHNIVEIIQEGTQVIFLHNTANSMYKAGNLTTTCELSNLKYGRHCLTPDFLKKYRLPEDVGPNLFD